MPVEVEKRVEVVVTPTPMPVPPPGPRIYKLGIFEEPLTRNYWNYFGGPGASVWTGYVLNPVTTSLYGYSDQRFDWVPIVADGFPSPLIQETVDGKVLWTSRVKLRKGLKWSDGVEITAHDFAFVVDTVQRLQLGGNYASAIDEAFVDHVEALDSHTAKVFFKGSDQDGNAQTPGLSKWQFGLALAPILPKHYWEPIVESAVASSDDVAERREALFAHVPEGQPTGGGYVFDKWEPGAFFEHERDTGWFNTGTRVIEYENGAYRETNAALGYDVTFYGEATGPTALEFEVGPHADSEIFRKGFHDRVRDTPDLSVLSNTSNGFRYLGFKRAQAPNGHQTVPAGGSHGD